MTPELLLKSSWSSDVGVQLGRARLSQARDLEEVRTAKPGQPEAGVGLDAEVAAAGAGSAAAAEGPGPATVAEEPARKRRRGLAEHLQEKIKHHSRSGSLGGDRERRAQRKKEKERRRKESRRKKKDLGATTSSDSSEGSGSGDSPFHSTSARGGELWRIAQKKPGRLTERSLEEMTRYLADRADYGDDERRWSGQKILAYLNQVVLVNNPPQKIGVRSHRELLTLAIAIDQLLEGQIARGLDILVQRFKAVEASCHDGGWNTAKHLELIPPTAASLTREDEREAAAKAEMRSLKLLDAVAKARKTK